MPAPCCSRSSSTSAATSSSAPRRLPDRRHAAAGSGLAQWLSSETYAFAPGCRRPSTSTLRQPVPAHDRAAGRDAHRASRRRCETETELAVDPERAVHAGRRRCPTTRCMYLLPSRYCPSDKLERRRHEIVGKARARLRPGRGDPRLDPRTTSSTATACSDASTYALDTLDARRRRLPRLRPRRHRAVPRAAHPGAHGGRLPARLEPMDLHAWFEAFVGGRWYTFDATQASRAAAASCWPTAATPPTWPSSRTTGRWRRSRCRSGSSSRRRLRPRRRRRPPRSRRAG